jgi:hypothetical protein
MAQGASVDHVMAQSTSVDYVMAQGASVDHVMAQGASVDHVMAQGASVDLWVEPVDDLGGLTSRSDDRRGVLRSHVVVERVLIQHRVPAVDKHANMCLLH